MIYIARSRTSSHYTFVVSAVCCWPEAGTRTTHMLFCHETRNKYVQPCVRYAMDQAATFLDDQKFGWDRTSEVDVPLPCALAHFQAYVYVRTWQTRKTPRFMLTCHASAIYTVDRVSHRSPILMVQLSNYHLWYSSTRWLI